MNTLVRVEFLTSKSDAASKAIETLKKFQQALNSGVSAFRSDGCGDYKSLSLQEYFNENGIDHEITPP